LKELKKEEKLCRRVEGRKERQNEEEEKVNDRTSEKKDEIMETENI
jgi:hypothetical protein